MGEGRGGPRETRETWLLVLFRRRGVAGHQPQDPGPGEAPKVGVMGVPGGAGRGGVQGRSPGAIYFKNV